ncbi:MAG: rod shape-determining protein MreC [Alphaproteobacteria bacterium]|nr:rod shape-determining protein MreC [Alphaproteobacteria bacterium]
MVSVFKVLKIKGVRRRNSFFSFLKKQTLKLGIVLLFLASLVYGIFFTLSHHTGQLAFSNPISYAMSILIQSVNQPFLYIETKYAELQSFKALTAANESLKSQMQKLEAQNRLLSLQLSDVNRFTQLINAIDKTPYKSYPARVLGTISHFPQARLFVQTESIPHHRNMVAINDTGYVGRVIERIGSKRMRILMITDHQSRVPVRHHKTGMQAILEGQGTPHMTIKYIENYTGSQQPAWQENDIFVTTGIHDACPPNIPVATVVMNEDGSFLAKPLVNLQQMRFVQLVSTQEQIKTEIVDPLSVEEPDTEVAK